MHYLILYTHKGRVRLWARGTTSWWALSWIFRAVAPWDAVDPGSVRRVSLTKENYDYLLRHPTGANLRLLYATSKFHY